MDRRCAAIAGNPGENIGQYHPKTFGGIGGLLKKLARIGVDRVYPGTLAAVETDHLAELSGENFRIERPLQDVRARIAGLQYVHRIGSIVCKLLGVTEC